ncbi:hypothetical protein A0H81_12495 [Grifola frondosa]|uniref:Het-C-domain-containing protein n=1 Tax=Grifola frondosa TaxID=5627 RepID=A0A1C7LSP3_GRIFR|nr:hypothetical protein A0H81_12495 [Grifola frondosa]
MAASMHIFLLVLCVVVLCVPGNGVYAFGAGNIPSFAYMEGRAFRHGDIEDALSEIAKKAGGFALGALIGRGGSKFGPLDIKRVYFGNWLRDYSQAVDVAGLQKLQLQSIVNLCMVLGFMAHGYATQEFEVTEERLGVYLPTEHIDNPKGYPDNARSFHPKLRGPVDPRELEIDPRTGMKNYIANENGSWDTSKALVRRTLERCIHLGRQHRANNMKQDEYEAYRLLGQALHTLEDFPAHSNFCELALVSMGHSDVFVHIGDHVRVRAHNGKSVAPLVTGTFGSSDFIHSLLGEATDHISQASVTDLNAELNKAREKSGPGGPGGPSPADTLRDLLFKLPMGDSGETQREMEGVERIRAGPSQGGKRPEDMSPQELHAVLWQVLTFRDSVVKKISMTIEKIPGLGPLIDKLMDSISVFVFTTLEPFLKPIMKQATTGLMAASGEVIDTHDQYEVFNDPRASDPTHSFLSKDHFNLILNEPAGHLGKIILTYAVNLVVRAWDDTSMNVHQITDDILSCLFHPDFHDRNSQVQREMMEYMQRWVQGMGGRQHETLRRLSKESVRNHENIRAAGEGGPPAAQGSYAQNVGMEAQHDLHGYLSQVPGVSQAQSLMGKIGGGGSSGSSSIPSLGQAQALFGTLGASSGIMRDTSPGEPSAAGYQPGGQQYGTQSGYDGPRPPATGQAASYYSESQTTLPSGEVQTATYGVSTYRPPPQPSFPGGPSGMSYAPPPRPPPGGSSGYAPSYAPSYSSPTSFPSADMGSTYPGQEGYGGGGSYGPPPGRSGFPNPDFPDTDFPPPHPHPHPHHHHGPPGYPPPGGFPGSTPPPSDRPFGCTATSRPLAQFSSHKPSTSQSAHQPRRFVYQDHRRKREHSDRIKASPFSLLA